MDKEQLTKRYIELHPENKKPFAGWSEAELTNKIATMEGKKPAPINKPEPVKTVTLTEEELRKIVNGDQETRRNIFTSDLEPVEEEPETPRVHTCKVALYKKDIDSPEGVVTDLKTVRRDKDPVTQLQNIDICRATVTYPDGKTEDIEYPIGDHYKIFTVREDVEIIEKKDKKMKMDKGYVYKTKTVEKNGIRTRMDGERTSVQVPMRERFTHSTFTVRRRNGQEFTLKPKVINI
jgi:hypothetical protein